MQHQYIHGMNSTKQLVVSRKQLTAPLTASNFKSGELDNTKIAGERIAHESGGN
jgi:hypothetical protein